MGYKPKAPDIMPDINVVPMADIMLVLLIIFMVVTPMLQKGFSVDMAQVEQAQDMQEADRDDAVLIAITRDGRFYMGASPIDIAQVAEETRDLLAATDLKTVYIKSDARAPFGSVVQVVDEVRSIGVDQIGLLTERIEKREGRPPALAQARPAPRP